MTASRRDKIGSVVSAAFGVVALVACLLVVVLTDDDLDVASGSPVGPMGARPDSPPGSGQDDPKGSAGSSSGGAGSSGPDITECTETECPGTGAPEGDPVPPEQFPYPPGTTQPQWTDDFCPDSLLEGTTVRQVRMPMDQARDWYLTNILDYGYGWESTTLNANPFAEDASGREVPLGWDGSLLTNDPTFYGRLALEGVVGPRRVCGPAKGVVYIQVTLS